MVVDVSSSSLSTSWCWVLLLWFLFCFCRGELKLFELKSVAVFVIEFSADQVSQLYAGTEGFSFLGCWFVLDN